MPCFAAGDLINAALKAAYGSSLVPCFNKTPGLFEGHPLFTTLPQQGTVQKRVQLNLPLLLQELAPSAGAGAPAAVRASVLLQCVSSRVWDRSSPQLDMARRTLAYFLVHKANPGLAEDPAAGNLQANPDGEAYTETYAHAGGATRSIFLCGPGGKSCAEHKTACCVWRNCVLKCGNKSRVLQPQPDRALLCHAVLCCACAPQVTGLTKPSSSTSPPCSSSRPTKSCQTSFRGSAGSHCHHLRLGARSVCSSTLRHCCSQRQQWHQQYPPACCHQAALQLQAAAAAVVLAWVLPRWQQQCQLLLPGRVQLGPAATAAAVRCGLWRCPQQAWVLVVVMLQQQRQL